MRQRGREVRSPVQIWIVRDRIAGPCLGQASSRLSEVQTTEAVRMQRDDGQKGLDTAFSTYKHSITNNAGDNCHHSSAQVSSSLSLNEHLSLTTTWRICQLLAPSILERNYGLNQTLRELLQSWTTLCWDPFNWFLPTFTLDHATQKACFHLMIL